MEFYTILAMAMAAAVLSVCESSDLGSVGSLSYTDSLLGGVGRFAKKVHARPALGAVVTTGLNGCDNMCPIGTVCALQLGAYRCVARSAGLLNTLTSDIGFDDTYGTGIGLTSGVAGINIGNKARLINDGFAPDLGSTCGFLAPECRATRRNRNAVYKFTFDPTFNRCVRIRVCLTCANFNSAQDNLFDNRFQCARFCQ